MILALLLVLLGVIGATLYWLGFQKKPPVDKEIYYLFNDNHK